MQMYWPIISLTAEAVLTNFLKKYKDSCFEVSEEEFVHLKKCLKIETRKQLHLILINSKAFVGFGYTVKNINTQEKTYIYFSKSKKFFEKIEHDHLVNKIGMRDLCTRYRLARTTLTRYFKLYNLTYISENRGVRALPPTMEEALEAYKYYKTSGSIERTVSHSRRSYEALRKAFIKYNLPYPLFNNTSKLKKQKKLVVVKMEVENPINATPITEVAKESIIKKDLVNFSKEKNVLQFKDTSKSFIVLNFANTGILIRYISGDVKEEFIEYDKLPEIVGFPEKSKIIWDESTKTTNEEYLYNRIMKLEEIIHTLVGVVNTELTSKEVK